MLKYTVFTWFLIQPRLLRFVPRAPAQLGVSSTDRRSRLASLSKTCLRFVARTATSFSLRTPPSCRGKVNRAADPRCKRALVHQVLKHLRHLMASNSPAQYLNIRLCFSAVHRWQGLLRHAGLHGGSHHSPARFPELVERLPGLQALFAFRTDGSHLGARGGPRMDQKVS